MPGAGVEPARGLPRGILSPLRLPIPPPGQRKGARCAWRLSPESNRGTRLCRPLHNHSATQPVGGRIIAALPPGSPCGTWPGNNTRHHRLNRVDPGRKPGNRPVKTPGIVPGNGAGNETRTRDPNLGKVVLYQLSYSRMALESREDDSMQPAPGVNRNPENPRPGTDFSPFASGTAR